MNIAEGSIHYKVITWTVIVMVMVGGFYTYGKLGRLEDPEFTIKEAKIITQYPGATAMEVAEEVTDQIETAVQQMGQLKRVTSISEPGRSTIRVEMKDKYDKHSLPQVWDELRRKVNDAQSTLPPGTTTSIVYDDFGDVYGIFYAVYGDGYSYAEIKDHAKMLRRELLLCKDVAKVAIFGDQPEAIYVEISRAKISQLEISPETIYASLAGQNLVTPAGRAIVDDLYPRIQPTGEFQSIEQIGDLLIVQRDPNASPVYLKDVATLTRDYIDPPQVILRFNGHPAIGLGLSTVMGGNVITMGDSVKKRLSQLMAQTPIGIEIGTISHQSDAVTIAVQGFVVSLFESLVIVIGVLMITMGFRSGMLIGLVLLLTVLATFIIMYLFNIMLERISLGALIIALGMLVDNAIVVTEGILVNIQRGMNRIEAASKIVAQTIWPLFGATLIAVLAFAAIGASQDKTGEYTRSLFLVILISLMLSWIFAITVTPLLGVKYLKANSSTQNEDPYGGFFFRGYRSFLNLALKHRWVTMLILAVLLVLSIYGFGHVKQSFFPHSTRTQIMVHYWLTQGTHIEKTEADLKHIEKHILNLENVTDVSTFVGQGALRFLLTYTPEDANNAYGLLLVGVKDYNNIDKLIPQINHYVQMNFPESQVMCRKFILGPGEAQKIQVRFRGDDPDKLRMLARQAAEIFQSDAQVQDIMDDWRQRVALIRPVISETQARNAGITRSNIARTIQAAFEGVPIGIYREYDELLPIIGRSPENERDRIDYIQDIQIWSPIAQKSIPITQTIVSFESRSENSIVRRRNRLPTITVKCDPVSEQASVVFERLQPKIEAIPLPQGYQLEWGGEYENSNDAQSALASKIPPVFLLMVLVLIVLFNNFRQPSIILLTVPLAVIGVTAGLLLTDQPFGFMALLGFMSLSGMQIKNAIVLIDEINTQLADGRAPFAAILDSGVSRVRPVSMAALTTVLGMVPLLPDAFFVAMAVTIMFGLTFATILTLIVVPVLYVIFYRIPYPKESQDL